MFSVGWHAESQSIAGRNHDNHKPMPHARGRRKNGPRANIATPCDFCWDRLREFQQWYRNRAQPHEKRFQESVDLICSLQLPVTAQPSAYLAALLAYWWLDDCGRDAVGWLLAEPKPNWQDVRRLLSVAAGMAAPAAKPRRRGLGATPANSNPKNRAFFIVQRWHAIVVDQDALASLARSMGPRASKYKMKASKAASALAVVRGVGPYWAKNVINTLFSHGFLEFDLGVVGPGALATLAWLRGGEGTLQSQGIWPTVDTRAAVIARQGVAQLATMESFHWLDMQHALCLWRCSGVAGQSPTRAP